MSDQVPDGAREALAAALPIDPDDGTVILSYEWHAAIAVPLWGPPETCADALLAALSAAGYAVVPGKALAALLNVYDKCWHEMGTYDPGRELISDGVKLTGIAELVSTEDSWALEQACDAFEPHEAVIRAAVGPWVPVSGEEQKDG